MEGMSVHSGTSADLSFFGGTLPTSSSSSASRPKTSFLSGGRKAKAERGVGPVVRGSAGTKDKGKGRVVDVRPKSPAYILPSEFPLTSLLDGRELANRPLPKSASTSTVSKRSAESRKGSTNPSEGPLRSSQTGKDKKVKNISSSQGSSNGRIGSSSNSNDYSQKSQTKAKVKRASYSSDDELSIGATPERHRHQFKREDSVPTASSSPTNDSSVNRKRKGTGRKSDILVAASQEDLGNDCYPTPRAGNKRRKEKSSQRMANSSNSDSDGDIDILSPIGKVVKHRPISQSTSNTTVKGKIPVSSDDDERTPRPAKSSGERIKAKRTVSLLSSEMSEDEKENQTPHLGHRGDPRRTSGATFFAQLGKYSSDNEVDYGMLNETSVVHEPDELDHDDLSPEDNKYLEQFKNQKDLCPYCSEAMPLHPSDHLKQLQAKLETISEPHPTSLNPNGRHLAWQQCINFCALHRAEAKIIPLGLRDGFPTGIIFAKLEQRLEEGWISEYLDAIAREPNRSKAFQDAVSEISKVGKLKWSGIRHQSNEDMLQAVMPGYYGELGRHIIVNHFLRLLRWGHLPTLKSGDGSATLIEPLAANDFISHVLVPEASIMLIMADQGHRSFSESGHAEAARIREKSVDYGRWKFRDDDEGAKRVLAEIEAGMDEKRERLRKSKVEKRQKSSWNEEKENDLEIPTYLVNGTKAKAKDSHKSKIKAKPIIVRDDTTSSDSIVLLEDQTAFPLSTSTVPRLSPVKFGSGSGRSGTITNTGKRKATTPLSLALGPSNSQLSEGRASSNGDIGSSAWGEDDDAFNGELIDAADEAAAVAFG